MAGWVGNQTSRWHFFPQKSQLRGICCTYCIPNKFLQVHKHAWSRIWWKTAPLGSWNAGTSFRRGALGLAGQAPSGVLSPRCPMGSHSSFPPQFDMQRITLEELKHILYHAFRDHLTMKDIENIIINEEESLNDTSGNCQTEFEGGRCLCFCFRPGLGQAKASISPAWKICLQSPGHRSQESWTEVKWSFSQRCSCFFCGFAFFPTFFPKVYIFAKPLLSMSFLQWLSKVCH